ncbi:MAG: tripartite tricarboxylate transporter permease [Candidatus Aenigmatarchaeota archaeon]
MLEVLAFLLAGVLIGILTGLIPGFHPNLIATLAVSYAFFSPLSSSVLLVSAGVTNTFVNFIPAVYLGAPSASTALSVLPGHKLLLKGRGREAIRLTVVGGLVSVFLATALFPVLYFGLETAYGALESYIPYLLIGIILYMVWKDRRVDSVFFFFLSGLLGYVVLEHNFIGTMHDLFPLLAGLFGIPMLVHSFRKDPKIPMEDRSIEHISSREVLREGTLGSIAGIIVGLLPGIGSAQATYLVREVTDEDSERGFMLAIGGVNTSNILVSVFAVYLIGKGRSGVAVSIQNLIQNITFNEVTVLVLTGLISAGLAAAAAIYLARHSLRLFRNLNYRKLCMAVMVFIFSVSGLLTGLKGLAVAAVASFIGLSCLLSGSRRSYLMGSILFPVILFFL